MAVAWLDPINTNVDLGVLKAQGRRTVQRLLSLGFFLLFPFVDRGGHISLCLSLQSTDLFYWAHWYPTEALETSNMIRKTAIKERKVFQHRGAVVYWVCFSHVLYRSYLIKNNFGVFHVMSIVCKHVVFIYSVLVVLLTCLRILLSTILSIFCTTFVRINILIA